MKSCTTTLTILLWGIGLIISPVSNAQEDTQFPVINLGGAVAKSMDLIMQKDIKGCLEQLQNSQYPLRGLKATQQIQEVMKEYVLTKYQYIFQSIVDETVVGTASLEIFEKQNRDLWGEAKSTTYSCRTQLSEIR